MSKNSPKGRLQVALGAAAVVFVMLVAALALYRVGGSHGLGVPTSGGSASRH